MLEWCLSHQRWVQFYSWVSKQSSTKKPLWSFIWCAVLLFLATRRWAPFFSNVDTRAEKNVGIKYTPMHMPQAKPKIIGRRNITWIMNDNEPVWMHIQTTSGGGFDRCISHLLWMHIEIMRIHVNTSNHNQIYVRCTSRCQCETL